MKDRGGAMKHVVGNKQCVWWAELTSHREIAGKTWDDSGIHNELMGMCLGRKITRS